MSGYLLDTTVIIDHAQGHAAGVQIVQSLFEQGSELFTCEVVTCESLARGNADQIAAVAALLDALEYVALSPAGARWAGAARRTVMEAGRRKPSTTDALIAAIAHSLGATVVTRNAEDFEALGVSVLGYGIHQYRAENQRLKRSTGPASDTPRGAAPGADQPRTTPQRNPDIELLGPQLRHRKQNASRQ